LRTIYKLYFQNNFTQLEVQIQNLEIEPPKKCLYCEKWRTSNISKIIGDR